jgi:hypothetical protein
MHQAKELSMIMTGMSIPRTKQLHKKLEMSLNLYAGRAAYRLTRYWIFGSRNWEGCLNAMLSGVTIAQRGKEELQLKSVAPVIPKFVLAPE